jgi:hypothetical protein
MLWLYDGLESAGNAWGLTLNPICSLLLLLGLDLRP